MKIKPFLFLFLVMSTNVVANWESVILESNMFKYSAPSVAPSSSWILPEFDDSSWSSTPGGFGYADGDDNTIITGKTSIYLRKNFDVDCPDCIKRLVLDVDYDDAFIAYLNGVEIARSSNVTEKNPGLISDLTTDHEANMYSGGLPDRYHIDPSGLVSGDNVLAVHTINISATSSDMSIRVFLHAEIEGNSSYFYDTPEWFQAPVTYDSSPIPILYIGTQGQTIVDEPKIMTTLKVIDNADVLNFFSDTTYSYNSYAGVEIRGNTSKSFPKKSYTVETRNADESNNNVEFLGMPKENDWVLHGPYTDKSLMRNALAYHIGRGMGHWCPRTRFAEVMINNNYEGIYLACEKIKIDKNRVDIATLKEVDTIGDELTGGYIISIDRDQEGSWNSPYMGRTGSVDIPFSYVDPKYDELTETQREYIKYYITAFEDALHGSDFKDPDVGYRAYIDVESFVDYFIITELSRDLDGYRVSVFFHKDKDSKGGLLTMSPFWDYNLCFGNANFFEAGNVEGWAEEGIGAGDWYEIPFWWDKFRSDPYFETVLKYRWNALRETVLSDEELNAFMDSCATLLQPAQARNFDTYDILDTYVWPNNYVGGTFENEVDYLKTWVVDRAHWIDGEIANITPSFPNAMPSFENNPGIEIYPNPFVDHIMLNCQLSSSQQVQVEVYDVLGRSLWQYTKQCEAGANHLVIDLQALAQSSFYLYSIRCNGHVVKTGKLYKF